VPLFSHLACPDRRRRPQRAPRRVRVGEDDRLITSVDEDGVALAAIKALHAENCRLHAENGELRARLEVLERKVEALVRR
jgi:hypothetical protein